MKIETVIAANRFGLGTKPGDLEKIDKDPKRWLLGQLEGPSGLPADIRQLPDTATVLLEVQEVRQMQRDARRAVDDEPAPDVVQKFGAIVRRHYLEQAAAKFRVATSTDFPFHERLVGFWANHFAVSADKQPVSALAGLFENEAIRPHLSGKFVELLLAVEKHPAMILYLDNQRSIGPNSTLAKRASRRQRAQQLGLNENLAREILELHTLGVDGGYSQQDVTTFARVSPDGRLAAARTGGLPRVRPAPSNFVNPYMNPVASRSSVIATVRMEFHKVRRSSAILRHTRRPRILSRPNWYVISSPTFRHPAWSIELPTFSSKRAETCHRCMRHWSTPANRGNPPSPNTRPRRIS